jgi:hypothetical protein
MALKYVVMAAAALTVGASGLSSVAMAEDEINRGRGRTRRTGTQQASAVARTVI